MCGALWHPSELDGPREFGSQLEDSKLHFEVSPGFPTLPRLRP